MSEQKWDLVIDGRKSIFDLKLKEIWRYRDLIQLFVKRDFVANFKQTILGPLWFVIQPLFQALVVMFVFGKIAGFQPDGITGMSFYLIGITCWTFFSGTLNSTSNTFLANAGIFGKVYFPRLVTPISLVLSESLKSLVQLILFLAVFIFELIGDNGLKPNWTIALVPIYFLHIGILSLGIGLIISAMTTKYRDVKFLVQFGIQLLMYASTVPYPLSVIRKINPVFEKAVALNPISSVIEMMRYAFMGESAGEFNLLLYTYSLAVSLILLLVGIAIFNRVEKNFMDTV